ncbi:MAG: hypothetical protein QM647_08985 [Asticcacaulis sp.]|uniref:hypothetical protein n=1 Tax=Asticcacaulis sp. TaxID=1872648 RepID=UPI0039E3BA4A
MVAQFEVRRRQALGLIGLGGLAALPARAATADSGGGSGVFANSALLTYEPITQTRAENVSFSRKDATGVKKFGSYAWDDLSVEETKSLLSNHSQWVSIVSKDAFAKGNAATIVKGELSVGDHTVIVDFLRYMTESVRGEKGELLGRYVVGVGLRTLCDVNVQKGKVEASLVALAAQAEANNAHGRIRFDSIGINSDEVTGLMPTTVALDESAIVQAASATAAIKALMKDNKTGLVPHIMAIQYESTATDGDRAKLLQAINRTNQPYCLAT